MKQSFTTFHILFFSGLVAVFVLFSFVLAQEIDKERIIQIVQTQGGPGGCRDEASCRTFCDNPNNVETCLNWAHQNGLISSEEADRAERLSKVGREFSGPGGCRSHEECERFCRQPENQDVCLDFAVQQGFLTASEAERIKEFRRQAEGAREEFEVEIDPDFDEDRAAQILETQGGPGGCRTFEECEEFCEEPQNQEACFTFAERHGLFNNQEAARKIKRIIEEGGPGGCRGERQCREFCENPDNFEVCIEFAQRHEFIKPEEVERARRGIRALREGGPGGCRGPRECEAFCSNPANQEICFEWAKKHGFVSEEQIRMMEEFRQRREEIERKHERRGGEFRPSEGFHPPGEFLGPGGCVGADQCRRYCEDPAHKEECERFRTSSGQQPPGFGGTPPPGGITPHICPMMPTVDSCPPGHRKEVSFSSPECGTYYQCVLEDSPLPGYSPSPTPTYTESPSPYPTYSPSPTVSPTYEDPATRCAKEGGTWNSQTSTCVFEKSGSILLNTGAYIKGAFRDFFFR
ncbi:MAG: hypothetical protein AAB627_01590 [Patescibacteria group bacterium]